MIDQSLALNKYALFPKGEKCVFKISFALGRLQIIQRNLQSMIIELHFVNILFYRNSESLKRSVGNKYL